MTATNGRCAATQLVDRRRGDLLAGPGLAIDEDRQIACSEPLEQIVTAQHRRICKHDLVPPDLENAHDVIDVGHSTRGRVTGCCPCSREQPIGLAAVIRARRDPDPQVHLREHLENAIAGCGRVLPRGLGHQHDEPARTIATDDIHHAELVAQRFRVGNRLPFGNMMDSMLRGRW